jgi:hypothetical protein
LNFLFFSPFAAISRHLDLELRISRLLISAGHQVYFADCKRDYEKVCISMSAHGVGFDAPETKKSQICHSCITNSIYRSRDLGLTQHSLLNFDTAAELPQIPSLIRGINQDNWNSFEVGGVPIGKYAAYEFFLKHKLISNEIPEGLWQEYLTHFEYSLRTYFSATNYFETSKHSIDVVLIYNWLYSVNRTFAEVAQKYGVAVYSIHAGSNIENMYRKLSLHKSSNVPARQNISPAWKQISEKPLKFSEIRNVKKHLSSLTKAKSPWVYSLPKKGVSAKAIREYFKFSKDSKLILIGTSSEDEFFTSRMVGLLDFELDLPPKVFSSQVEWIDWLIENFGNQKGYEFILRLHPREFANKRESVNSKNGINLVKYFGERLPENFALNTPEDKLSIYDLMGASDCLLTQNSSIALEFSAFGIPALGIDLNYVTGFPGESVFVARNKKEYAELIRSNHDKAAIRKRKLATYRWFNYKFNYVESKLHEPSWPFFANLLKILRKLKYHYNLPIPSSFFRFVNRISSIWIAKSSRETLEELFEKRLPGLEYTKTITTPSRILPSLFEKLLITHNIRKFFAG